MARNTATEQNAYVYVAVIIFVIIFTSYVSQSFIVG